MGGGLRFLWQVVICLVDMFVFVLPRERNRPGNDLLLVRLDAIGDFVLWADSAKQIRILYPDHFIVLLANNLWSDFAGEFGAWDEVWDLEPKKFGRNLFYRVKRLYDIRRRGFRVAIHPTYSRDFLGGDSVIRTSGASEKIGMRGDRSNISRLSKAISDRWYTRLIDTHDEKLTEVERNSDFIRQLGLSSYRCGVPDLRAMRLKSHHVFNLEEPYYVLVPGAGWDGRRWPIERFARLAEKIYSETSWRGVICGGPPEIELCENLLRSASCPLINLAGKTQIVDLAAILRASRMVVSNETGAVHLGAAVGAQVTCILGGGHFGRFIPYRAERDDETVNVFPIYFEMPCYHCNWKCIYDVKVGAPVPCVDNISIDRVWSCVKGLLKKSPACKSG